MLTMFEIMLANWGPPCRVLVNKVDEAFALGFIFYRCYAGFAVLNVINAVFIQQTLKVAQNDKEIMIKQKMKAQEDYVRKLKALFWQLDTSGDGLISWDEFQCMMTNSHLKTWLSALEIDPHDLQQFFELLDDGDGQLTINEFVGGISRLKGYAKAVDMAQLVAMHKRLDAKFDRFFATQAKTGFVPHSKLQVEGAVDVDWCGVPPPRKSPPLLPVVPSAIGSEETQLPHCVE